MQASETNSTLSRRTFIRSATLGAIALGSGFPAPVSSAATNVPRSRLDRLSKGANVCRWFRFAPQSPEHLSGYISESEAALMRKIGLQHVRLCVHPSMVMEKGTGAIRDEVVKYLDQAIDRFHRADLLVVVDLHNEDRADELDPVWQENFIKLWGKLAGRFSRFSPDMTIFEIVNEPVFNGRAAEWDVLNQKVTAAIRSNAPKHTIMTSGPGWGGIDGLFKLKLLEDPNVVYSFHCYDPFPFTHQGATWSSEEVKPLRGIPYPSSPESVAPILVELMNNPKSQSMIEQYGIQRWNKAKLAERFKQAVDWGKKNNVTLYCGEFGVFPAYAKPEHRANWFRDFGQVLEENNIGWAVWGWDEGFGLNRRHAAGKIVLDTVVSDVLGLKRQ